MAVYRKKLVDKDGNTIIPAVGDIYGPVYTATLSSATAGGRADYEFAPDTPVENNKVYAVQFPAPTVNNATIILGDGVSSGSILVPPVAATDSPNYDLLTTDMINSTEPLLLMYNGVQWVCLNQKNKVATADLGNKSVTSAKVDWTTLPGSAGATAISGKMSGTSWANIGNAFKAPSNGLYFVSAIFNQNGNPGANAFIMGASIVSAGNAFSTAAPSAPNYAGNHNCTITLSRMTWLTAGQTIQMQGRTENWSGGVAGKMEVTRIY